MHSVSLKEDTTMTKVKLLLAHCISSNNKSLDHGINLVQPNI